MKSGGIIRYLSAARLLTRVEGAASAGQRLNGPYNEVTGKNTCWKEGLPSHSCSCFKLLVLVVKQTHSCTFQTFQIYLTSGNFNI